MDRPQEENGAAKPLEEVGSEQYSQPIDRQQLINEGSEVSPLQMEQEKSSSKCVGEGLKVIIVSSISFSIAVTVALIVTIYFGPPQIPPHGGVACDATECSEIGQTILEKGGSSVDAAIAATFCMGVVRPQNSGIGGGGVMVIHHTKKVSREHITNVLDFLEVAPSKTRKDDFNDAAMAEEGAMAVAVPGQVKGLEEAHRQFGKLKWQEVVMPAANLAQNGFNVSEDLVAGFSDLSNGEQDDLEDLVEPSLKLVKVGDKVTSPRLANVLKAIAMHGSNALYEGTIANNLVKEVTDSGGILVAGDLRAYKVKARNAVVASVLDTTLATAPAPAGGASVLSIVNIMEAVGISPANVTGPTNAFFQNLVKVMRLGYAQQGLLGDPDFNPQMQNVTVNILSEATAEELANKTKDSSLETLQDYLKAVGSFAPDVPSQNMGTHVSVIGPDDFLISTSSSINSKFGSKILTSSGFLLNNQMAAFSSSGPNEMAPGKRPLSLLSPTVVYSKLHPCSSRVAIGGSQGNSLIADVAQVLLNMFGFHQDVATAVEQPRFYPDLKSNDVQYEDKLANDIKAALTEDNALAKQPTKHLGYVNVVYKINETVQAQTDSRSGGMSAEF